MSEPGVFRMRWGLAHVNGMRQVMHQCVAMLVDRIWTGSAREQRFGRTTQPVKREQRDSGHAAPVRLCQIGAVPFEQFGELSK